MNKQTKILYIAIKAHISQMDRIFRQRASYSRGRDIAESLSKLQDSLEIAEGETKKNEKPKTIPFENWEYEDLLKAIGINCPGFLRAKMIEALKEIGIEICTDAYLFKKYWQKQKGERKEP